MLSRTHAPPWGLRGEAHETSQLPACTKAALTVINPKLNGWWRRYVYSRGMSEASLAWARGGGAVFGLVGTFMYPYVAQHNMQLLLGCVHMCRHS